MSCDDPSTVIAENNFWAGATESTAISDKMSGPVDFEPFLTQLPIHSADQDADFNIRLEELLRVIQLFNSNGYHCDDGTEDGFAPGPGLRACLAHAADYAPEDFDISLSELLRTIQFFNVRAYARCDTGEDGFCPGAEGEGAGEGGN